MLLRFNPFTSNLDIVSSSSNLQGPPGPPGIPGASGVTGVIVNTQANILATTPTSGLLAFATDILKLYVANGTNWSQIPLTAVVDLPTPDMGYTQDSAKTGYGTSYITDKTLNNVVIGANGNPVSGGVRITTAGVFQVYVNGSWNTVDINFVFREDSGFGYTFEHQPVGFTTYVEIMTGQSLNSLGLNGLPIINAYKVSMGAYPVVATLGGRTII